MSHFRLRVRPRSGSLAGEVEDGGDGGIDDAAVAISDGHDVLKTDVGVALCYVVLWLCCDFVCCCDGPG